MKAYPRPAHQRPPSDRVASRADWRKLLELATACAGDADRGETEGREPELRLAHLNNRINAATTGLFAREAGAATDDAARAFVRVTKAFARSATSHDLRREMAPMVLDCAAFLDRQLTRLADDDFYRAHRGRPEVFG